MEKEDIQKLKDPVYVNYNLLVKLEEIKNILLAIYQIQVPKEKEEREGIIK